MNLLCLVLLRYKEIDWDRGVKLKQNTWKMSNGRYRYLNHERYGVTMKLKRFIWFYVYVHRHRYGLLYITIYAM